MKKEMSKRKRISLDVNLDLHAAIKIAAFRQGLTMNEYLNDILVREVDGYIGNKEGLNVNERRSKI